MLLVDVIDVSQHIDVGKAHLDFRFDHRLRADYVHFAGEAYADDRGGFARRMSFERRVDDQVYSLPDILRNFTIRARSGLARDVGRGGYQRPVQLADQLLAELVLGNPDAERTLLGNQILGDGAGSRQDQRQRLVGHFVQLPCDIGDFPDIKQTLCRGDPAVRACFFSRRFA